MVPRSLPRQAVTALDMHDHKRMTVLMHSVSKGPAPLFQEVHQAMREAFGGDDIVSLDDDKAIYTYVQQSGLGLALYVNTREHGGAGDGSFEPYFVTFNAAEF